MPADNWLETRKATVAALTAAAPIANLVPAHKIWGEVPPANIGWPFIRIGFPITTPFEATGWDGSQHRLTVHCFAKGEDTGDVSKIAKAVAAIVQGLVMPDALAIIDLQWTSTVLMRDTDEANAFHAAVQFDITVA